MLLTRLCANCGHELTQKSRSKLTLTGVAMLALAVPLLFRSYVWIVGILLASAGIYLLIWSVLGRGLWCRRCKKFPVSKVFAG